MESSRIHCNVHLCPIIEATSLGPQVEFSGERQKLESSFFVSFMHCRAFLVSLLQLTVNFSGGVVVYAMIRGKSHKRLRSGSGVWGSEVAYAGILFFSSIGYLSHHWSSFLPYEDTRNVARGALQLE